jgi:heavy metal translocating P-type ATPase
VITIAALTFAGWYFFGPALPVNSGIDNFTRALIYMVAVLVIACPCAMGLATPTAIMVGTGKGAESGILFRTSEALERAGRVTVVVLDKTGTITKGQPAVTDIVIRNSMVGSGESNNEYRISADELLRLAASVEKGSEHPLGESIWAEATTRGLVLVEPSGFKAEAGYGVQAEVEARSIMVGNVRMFQARGIQLGNLESEVARLQSEAKTVMLVAIDNQAAGIIAVADTIKDSSKDAIADLHQMGLKVVMITGDNQKTADAIAKQVGVDMVLAEVLPEGKSNEVKKLQANVERSTFNVVAMVGDGVNDAPALAQADVGIAIGTGTDVAMAAAPVTLMSGDLRGVARAINLSRKTLGTIKQNLFWAFFYNIVLIPAAALGYLNPMLAAGAMAFSSVFVVSNSLRLRGYKIEALTAPKTRGRRILETTPAVAGIAIILVAFIYFSFGRLQPVQENAQGGAMPGTMSFNAVLVPQMPIVAGVSTPLNIQIMDESGNPFTDFETNNFGRYLYYAYVAVASRDLTSLQAIPIVEDPYAPKANGVPGNSGSGGGMGMSPTASVQMTPEAAEPTWVEDRTIQPKFVFPSDGQYIVFVDFIPDGGEKVTLSVPVNVGISETLPAALPSGAPLTQTVGGLSVTLKFDGALKAGQDNKINFEVIDAQGQSRSEDIGIMSGYRCNLYVVDEAATSFLRPALTDRNTLQFSANFPKPGRYKVWFEFLYQNQPQQIAFVLNVK